MIVRRPVQIIAVVGFFAACFAHALGTDELKDAASIGVIVSGAAIEVSTQRAGKIDAVYVNPGQKVVVNERLFALQRSEVDNNIAVSVAALEQARAGQVTARTALDKAESEAARQAQAPALFSNAQRDAARFEVQTRESQLRAAVANVAELGARAQQSKAALDQVVVRAESAGTVAAVLRNPGELANPGDIVLRLERESTPRVRFALSTDRARELRVGDIVQVQDLGEQTAQAQVLMIAPDIDAPTGMVIAEAQPPDRRDSNWQCRSGKNQDALRSCGWQTGTAVEVKLLTNATSSEDQR
jgi:multidrug efflux pump subunit AcrA (membrane-fusion protein)